MNKAELRKIYLEKRSNISPSLYWVLNTKLLDQVKSVNWNLYQTVHVFMPINKTNEVDTFSILDYFKKKHPKLQLTIPRTNFESTEMVNVLFNHDYTLLKRNKYHIPEPIQGEIIPNSQLDAVLVPLLAFDRQGNRVGYGKGFYDRFLSQCRPDVRKIGLSFFDPVKEITDTGPFDIRLDCCITPDKIWEF